MDRLSTSNIISQTHWTTKLKFGEDFFSYLFLFACFWLTHTGRTAGSSLWEVFENFLMFLLLCEAHTHRGKLRRPIWRRWAVTVEWTQFDLAVIINFVWPNQIYRFYVLSGKLTFSVRTFSRRSAARVNLASNQNQILGLLWQLPISRTNGKALVNVKN